MNPNYTPEFDPQECVRGLGQDWYHINEDLARVWLGITKDGESTHLEDRIARTKMPYINWNELLKDPHFQLLLHRVDQEQQKGSPTGVFAARFEAFSRVSTTSTQPKTQVAKPLEAPLTPPARITNKTRLAVAFILGALAGSGLLKATQSTRPHTTVALPNR
jgi:hypothetical protein